MEICSSDFQKQTNANILINSTGNGIPNLERSNPLQSRCKHLPPRYAMVPASWRTRWRRRDLLVRHILRCWFGDVSSFSFSPLFSVLLIFAKAWQFAVSITVYGYTSSLISANIKSNKNSWSCRVKRRKLIV